VLLCLLKHNINHPIPIFFSHTYYAIEGGGALVESQVTGQIGTKFRRLSPCLRGQTFNGGVGDFVKRALQLQIQDGGRKRSCIYLGV